MGKKGRRTRWRTLTIADEHSDSEESNTTASGHRVPKGYPQKSYYGRFTYSSQSTPTRKYQCDDTKSTRSSSTASENKITFNEDEYTRITTPRQDVLFKKGYLNKPKTYQTQTSTGNSTTSTGNSTGNGTPDHQSTDLEYESQFVFPNGFVDQNGIYYVNSFEPYPVMVYNPPTYYPEYANVKTKRCSTGSLTESASPNNEETSQDLSQSETPNNVSDVNHVYNVIYPGYYYNGVCQPQEESTCEKETRRVKKRRRKLSSSKEESTTSESSDEVFSDEEAEEKEEEESPTTEEPVIEETIKEETEVEKKDEVGEEKSAQKEEEEEETKPQKDEEEETKPKYDLKPDAEEFVPRAYRHQETIPMEANVQFIKIPPNFVSVPILNPMGEFNAFIPTGIPINFIPQNYVNFVPYKHPNVHHAEEDEEEEERKDEEIQEETVEVPKTNNNNNKQIDIAKIVSKLEEAAKEQDGEKKEETQNVKKKKKFQKVELRRPPPPLRTPPPEAKKAWNSPKKEEIVQRRNYSETVRKSTVVTLVACERHERNAEKMKTRTPPAPPPMRNHQRTERTAKMSDEWIAVSSRKKRKNKNVEESEDFEEEKSGDVEEATKDAPVEVEVTIPEEVVKVPEVVVKTPEEVVKVPEELPVCEGIKEEKKTKKKSKKKSAPATATKRVIITDVDLSVEETKRIEETKGEEEIELKVIEKSKENDETKEEEVEMVEEVKEDEVRKFENEEQLVAEVEEEMEKEEKPIEEKKEEKKSKKKKKKLSKPVISVESNLADDSYDFLLDESLDKTNVEVSQELDKLIQRGMYNSLEEKIKSMNMESSDSFFKTIISNISSRESSVEKNATYIKSPNLSKLITTSPSLIKNHDRISGDFLSELTTPDPPTGGGDAASSVPTPDYPITRAVKEWMSKTRETAPEVEILKSPSAILREFGEETKIEEAEEVVETSDEDFSKMEEKKDKLPKHGNLPYRAICCSIM